MGNWGYNPYTLEVQRSLKEWVFTKDYRFSRDLLHPQFQGTIILTTSRV